MAHSPTPWTITEDKTSSFGPSYTVRDAKGKWLLNDTLYYPSAFSREDADFIVRAVNAHDDLVKALGDLYAVVWGECPSLLNEDSGGDASLDMRICELLSKAKEAQS